ncbi:LAME_0D09076g1_1 [Lachancea meyersii CBS 8951]|uniref:LAME_0D09076g1_1 n=1 Tax=Lachancea meyersii CBS 8951 TaxID=1266667 RepID=A0A1G4JB02_9SACH|nr:LAME_0D09076g1_1 [Lachancea meyersii CBS 8951]
MLTRRLDCLSRHSRNFTTKVLSSEIKERFSFASNSVHIRNLPNTNASTKVTLNGWIDKKPKKVGKDLIFGTLRDTKGDCIQLVDSQLLLKSANVEDVVQVEGHLNLKKTNDDKAAPQYEIQLSHLKVLNKSGKKPSQLLDYKKEGNYPPDLRYLQLRLPKYQVFLRKRHEIAQNVREHLNLAGFTEIETPILFKSTPEGAREFLVPTRNKINSEPAFYALPQSPQQYKQLLMASGVERYYQIARCFRDEDLRSDRQPEFTQIDMEMAFSSGEQVMERVESMVTDTWKKLSSSGKLHTVNRGKIVSINDTQSVTKMTYRDAMTRYGIDKPDLRFPNLKIIDLKEFKAYGVENKNFPVFEVLVLRNAFDTMENYKKNWSILSDEHQYNSRSPIVVPIDSIEMQNNWFEKFMPIANFENPTMMTRFLNIKQGDIVCGATRQPNHTLFENPTPLGRLRQLVTQTELGSKLYKETDHAVAAWIVEFPLFAPLEQESTPGSKKQRFPVYREGEFTSSHHPFTMVNLNDLAKLQKDPLSCSGLHYDFVVNGTELGGGSTRIHDPELQNYVFKSILKIKNPERLFGHLLTAFECGTPPHAGFAVGFDRMCAMMCGTDNIRDVIAFPKSISGSDQVVQSPSAVPEEILKEYNISFSTK